MHGFLSNINRRVPIKTKFRGTPLHPRKKLSTFVDGILDVIIEGLGEMFEGYSAEMCAGKIPLVPMGVPAGGPSRGSRNFFHVCE